ncbi:MAG TPA: RnfH family protein [Xanthomonadaceae bacterium]|nr:RnfH family protein [Xanthomonadaceae bacterium]
MTTEERIRVEVVYALPQRSWRIELELPAGATVADALAAADLQARIPGARIDPERLAIFARSVTEEQPLSDGDRIEVLRPLQCDPKEVRRRRARGET